jgi:hypothetical protein
MVLVVAATVLCAVGWCGKAHGQSAPAASGAGDTAGAPKKGFAIESEMLTYTAMDTEAGAVACSIAKNAGAVDASCTPHTMTGPPAGVVVVSDGSSALDEFQLWRTDISTMDMLTVRANRYCPAAQSRGVLSGLQSLMSMFPESEAASFAEGLLSAQATTAPLEGNILDQTLVNDVSGHLRELGLAVVIPDMYMPLSLRSLDQAHSPFLARFVALMKARGCVTPSAPARDAEMHKEATGSNTDQLSAEHAKEAEADADKRAIVVAIDAYLKSMNTPVPTQGTAKDQTGEAAPAAASPSITHLSAVLRADGLAQQLGAGSEDEKSGANGTWYVLWLKALESGGTLMKSGNLITGEKTSYSGGAVGTYAFFKLDGNLECSGAFFNLAGPWQTKDIANMLPSDQKTPPGRLVGGCNPNPR